MTDLYLYHYWQFLLGIFIGVTAGGLGTIAVFVTTPQRREQNR